MRVPTLIRIHPDRHVATADTLVFGCTNIRLIANKVDDLLQVRVDNSVDVMLLTETWHDKKSACFGRLCSEGFQVVDRPRPRLRDDVLSTNHGGVAVVAVNGGVHLSQFDLGIMPTTFEHVYYYYYYYY